TGDADDKVRFGRTRKYHGVQDAVAVEVGHDRRLRDICAKTERRQERYDDRPELPHDTVTFSVDQPFPNRRPPQRLTQYQFLRNTPVDIDLQLVVILRKPGSLAKCEFSTSNGHEQTWQPSCYDRGDNAKSSQFQLPIRNARALPCHPASVSGECPRPGQTGAGRRARQRTSASAFSEAFPGDLSKHSGTR